MATGKTLIEIDFRKSLGEEIRSACGELGAYQRKPEAGRVHSYRKSSKRIRAYLRLMRSQVGEKRFQFENQRIRDASRKLSELRDAEVLLETFSEVFGRKVPRAFQSFQIQLRESARQTLEVGPLIRELDELEERIAGWKKLSLDWSEVGEDLVVIYRRARKGMDRALVEGSAAAFHEWRKRTKVLRYDLRPLELLWPTYFRWFEKRLHEVEDRLGLDHDLAVLEKCLAGRLSKATHSRIEARRIELREQALALGEKLFWETPSEVRRRLQDLWKHGPSETGGEPGQTQAA